ncbi:MAG: SRPBCC domain-containing protein [Pseudomonadota bacterium]
MTNDRTLTLERQLGATPQAVYDAWTKPELLVQWWGPEGLTTPIHDMDVRPNGAWSTTMVNPDGGKHTCSGVYRVLEPPHRLVFTWAWEQDDGNRGPETQVEISLMANESGTLMRLVQGEFDTAETANQHGFGWNSSFNKLETFVG